VRHILATSRFIALQKKESLRDEHGTPIIRPVAIGEVWRRVMGRRVFRRAAAAYGKDLVQFGQYGLGLSAGNEHVSHGLRLLGAEHPGMGVLGTDATCAFNFIDRRPIWEDTLALGDKEVITYFLLFYSKPASQIAHGVSPGGAPLAPTSIPSVTGVQMGCSGGSFFFARSWTLRVLKPVQQDAALAAQPLAIHDDLYVGCAIEKLGPVSVRVKELAAKVGISLNLRKSFYFQWPAATRTRDNTLCDSRECRRRLGLLSEIPVREWDSPDGGFMCNGTPIGAPRYVAAQMETLVASFKTCLEVLLGLTGCSIQTRMLLLIFCVHSKLLHLLRGVPPSAGLQAAREIDEAMRLTVAAVTYTDPNLLSASHNNKALAQLQLQPSFGGANLTALEMTYQAAYTGSIAGSLTRIGDIPLLANGCNLETDQWEGRPGPLGEVYEAWHRGIAGPPLSSLPHLQKVQSLQGDDGTLSLSKLTCAPKKAQRTFARALAIEALAAITEDPTVDPLSRIRLKVCSAPGASDWLRAMPGADGAGLLLDAQYSVVFALFFGLPCKAIGPATTCVPTCPRAAKLGDPDLQERGWEFGHHFFHCGAGSRLEGVTNLLGRHDALAVTCGNCFSELGFTVCTDKRAQAYALTDGRKVDMSIENLSRCAYTQAIDFTIIDPWAHADDALAYGAGYLKKHGDDSKIGKHATHVQAAGALFLPASFSVLGAWGPAIQSLFDTLWQEKIQKAEDSGDPTWPIVQRKLAWRSKISVTLMRANAQMVLSRARQQGTLCPAHAHRANISHHASHRNPVQHPHDRRNLANSRSLCVARRGASARGV
jgi:hypothetical protein